MPRILVIDDDPLLRREVNQALTKLNHEVFEAAEPLEGIRSAQLHNPDLILLDILMPGMDGITVLRKLHADDSTSAIPVIIVTSLNSESQAAACLEEGAIDHVAKPFSHRMLCARVSAALLKNKMKTVSQGLAESPDRRATGRLIAFLGAKGGVGTTTIAANVASVAAQCEQSVILCELRSTFGTLSLQLNAQPHQHLGSLMQSPERLADVDLEDFLVRDSNGLRILFGPQVNDGDVRMQAWHAKRVIGGLRPLAKLIYLDLAPGLTELNAEILKVCDRIVLVLDGEPTSIMAASWTIDQLQRMSIPRSIKAVIVKRTELSLPPKIDDIQSSLGCELIGVVPPGANALALAAKSGEALVTLRPDDLVATAIRSLAEEHLLFETPMTAGAS